VSERIRITDVSPRDGLQNEPGVIPTADKARLIALLAAAHVDEVEVTSFVSKKWVPQLGDAQELCQLLAESPSLWEGVGVGSTPEIPSPREGFGVGSTPESPSPREGFGVGLPHPLQSTFQTPSRATPPHQPSPSPSLKDNDTAPPRIRETHDRAHALRQSMTGPEKHLWYRINDHKLGVKFRRQHPFGPYILDFFCLEARLAIELDGDSHSSPDARALDAERIRYINRHGVRVLRFSNDQVLDNVAGVCERIKNECERPTLPLPVGGVRGGFEPPVATNPPDAPANHASTPTHPSPLPQGGTQSLFSALVPNDKGIDALLEANRLAGRALIAKASVFAAASETFSRKNTNASIDEVLARFPSVIIRAHEADLDVRGYVSCVIACPFEGPIAPEAVARVARELIEMGVDELDLGDTIGAATPETIRAMLLAVCAAIDDLGDSSHHWLADGLITLHLHDTFGRAADCVREALALGVRSFDASVAGLGGCPYATTTRADGSIHRAPGNISTELLVRTIESAGFRAGRAAPIDHERLAEAGAFAREIVARSRLIAP
jgi:isopropylmalate/homocitrate/citramalate synthase/very-short-patch-repair endonuclease